MDDGLLQALQLMKENERRQLMQAGNAPTRSAFVERELERARQVPQMGRYRTGLGAALGGMGNLFETANSEIRQGKARNEQERLMKLLEDPEALRSIMGAAGGAAPAAAPKTKQQMLIDLLRQGGAGDTTLPPGMA